jgi:Zn-finger nucleic acid-binding protein
MKCPRDGEELVTKLYCGKTRFHVEICPKCHGVWFDQGELNHVLPELSIRLEQMKWKPAAASDISAVISPASGAACETLHLEVGDITIHRDPVTGGHWVDGCELEHVKDFAQTACQETRDHVDYIAREMAELGYH